MSDLGNKRIMASNLQYYMDLYGKTRNDLVNDLGFKYTTVSNWLQAEKYPRIDKIEMMANYFKISKADLVEDRNKHGSTSNTLNIPNLSAPTLKRVPLVGTIAAGTPILAEQNFDGYAECDISIRADFALTIRGDSMIGANIFDGDIVFIRQQPVVEDGEIAAVIIDDEATIKRFYKHGDAVELRPENATYKSMFFTSDSCDQFHIIGKAIAYQHILE